MGSVLNYITGGWWYGDTFPVSKPIIYPRYGYYTIKMTESEAKSEAAHAGRQVTSHKWNVRHYPLGNMHNVLNLANAPVSSEDADSIRSTIGDMFCFSIDDCLQSVGEHKHNAEALAMSTNSACRLDNRDGNPVSSGFLVVIKERLRILAYVKGTAPSTALFRSRTGRPLSVDLESEASQEGFAMFTVENEIAAKIGSRGILPIDIGHTDTRERKDEFCIVAQHPALQSVLTLSPHLSAVFPHYLLCDGYRWFSLGKFSHTVHDANTASGSAGSPIFDLNGQLLGMHIASGRCLPTARILSLIDKLWL